MPTTPKMVTLTNSSVDVLNVIRNYASQNYKDYVPIATPDAEVIRSIGAVIMDNPALRNEFLTMLMNRIGRVLITSRLYDNPLRILKQGRLEYGETVEEIFVNLAKAQQFDPEVAETNIFTREIPDVKAAFHIMNYQKFYKTTISNDQLRQAFLSIEGVTDLISKIVESLYTGANYDEYQVTLYMIAKNILNGRMTLTEIPAVTSANMNSIVSTIKGVSNEWEFMSENYNMAGVKTYSDKSSQYILLNSKFDATMDVEVLASAFNMGKAEFMGNRILVSSFGDLDTARLNELLAYDPTYEEISSTDLQALDGIPAIMVDKSFFMIFDNFDNMTEQYNGEGLYWNYWYHVWKTFSVSPFANNTMFVPATPAITSVQVSPSTTDLAVNTPLQLSVTVNADNFAPQTVTWSITSGSTATASVNERGEFIASATGAYTVTATSTYDPSKSGSCAITVE